MFADFVRSGKVRTTQPDIALAKSLLIMSKKGVLFAKTHSVNEDNASQLMVLYYEALRQVCEAVCVIQGYKVFSHEAFTAFIKELLGDSRLAEQFDRLRKLRNGVNYYGEAISAAETIAVSQEVPELILKLQRTIKVSE